MQGMRKQVWSSKPFLLLIQYESVLFISEALSSPEWEISVPTEETILQRHKARTLLFPYWLVILIAEHFRLLKVYSMKDISADIIGPDHQKDIYLEPLHFLFFSCKDTWTTVVSQPMKD